MAADISIRAVGPPEGKLCVIEVRGVLDAESADELEKALTTIIEKGLWRVIVDLSGVNYISSAGWGIFTGQIKEVRSRGGDIKLAAMQPGVQEVFQLLELDYFIQSFDTVEEAQERFLRRLGIPISPVEETIMIQPEEPEVEKVVPQPLEGRVPSLSEEATPLMEEKQKMPPRGGPPPEKREPTIEEKVEEILRENPTYGVWKVRKVLRSARYGHTKIALRRLHLVVKSLRQELAERSASAPSKETLAVQPKRERDEWAKLKEERAKLEEERRLLEREKERLREEWEKVRRERIALIKARRKAGFGASRRGPTHFNEIVKIVKQNPHLGPKSIKKELSTSAYGFINLSTSTIYRRLRERGLNTKEKRVRFASLGGETIADY